MSSKILFLVKDQNIGYGVTYGLRNSARMVAEALRAEGYDAEVRYAIDGNDIDRIVTNEDPGQVILEALWATPEKLAELVSIPRHSWRRWIVRMHSTAPFIACETLALTWLNGYSEVPGIVISANDKRFVEDLKEAGYNAALTPNVYPLIGDEPDVKRNPVERGAVHVSCFGATRLLKNQLQQGFAAVRYAKEKGVDLRFHVNSCLVENGNCILTNLRALMQKAGAELVEHQWRTHHDFLEVVRAIDIGMQVSFTESFNIVAADHVACAVPLVVSGDVTWMPPDTKVMCTDTEDIVRRMMYIDRWPSRVTHESWIALRKHNSWAMEKWEEFLEP
jgi:hypothetical protein